MEKQDEGQELQSFVKSSLYLSNVTRVEYPLYTGLFTDVMKMGLIEPWEFWEIQNIWGAGAEHPYISWLLAELLKKKIAQHLLASRSSSIKVIIIGVINSAYTNRFSETSMRCDWGRSLFSPSFSWQSRTLASSELCCTPKSKPNISQR